MMYLIEPKLLRNPHYRGRHWQFIGQSLEDLQHTAEALGHRIEVLEGDAVDVFTEVHRKLGIKRLLSYEETGLDLTFQRDQAVAKFANQRVSSGANSKPTASSAAGGIEKAGIGHGTGL